MKRLLIVSDIHGNWPALDAVLQAEKSYSAVAFCGDVVDYGPFPVPCLRWLQERADFAVRGNHDNALAFGQDCRCMGSFRNYALATLAWHRRLLTDADMDYLRPLPTLEWFAWGGKHFRMAHATPQGDLFAYLTADRWGDHVADIDADYVLLGHTHVAGMRTFGKTTVVNPGSVGLARDGGREACYAVYDGKTLQLKRVAYDVDRTIFGLKVSGLPEEVVQGLTRVLIAPRA